MNDSGKRALALKTRLDSLYAQEEVLWGSDPTAVRLAEMASDFLECSHAAHEISVGATALFDTLYFYWWSRTSLKTAGMHALEAYRKAQAPAGSALLCTIPNGVTPVEFVCALTTVQRVFLASRDSRANLERIRWCVETAAGLESTCRVPEYARGLLECGRAHVAWAARSTHLVSLGECEEEDMKEAEARSHLYAAAKVFGIFLGDIGGTLGRLPQSIDSSVQHTASNMALLGKEIAKLREEFGEKVGYWASTASQLHRLAQVDDLQMHAA